MPIPKNVSLMQMNVEKNIGNFLWCIPEGTAEGL